MARISTGMHAMKMPTTSVPNTLNWAQEECLCDHRASGFDQMAGHFQQSSQLRLKSTTKQVRISHYHIYSKKLYLCSFVLFFPQQDTF